MTRLDTTRNEPADGGSADAELRGLGERLQALAREESRLEAPPHVEATVLRAWDATHPQRDRARTSWAPWAATAAAAATIFLVAAITMSRDARVQAPPRPLFAASDVRLGVEAPPVAVRTEPTPRAPRRFPRSRPAVIAPSERAAATTVVLVGTPVMAGERMRVVRMRVARETLIGMGLRPIAQNDAASVDVEMLVGEDGVARALRVGM
jgi:hypothetical protein